MDKFEFIKSLLGEKKLKPHQREKIIELAQQEIESNADLEKRVNEIENVIYHKTTSDKKTLSVIPIDPETISDPLDIDPEFDFDPEPNIDLPILNLSSSKTHLMGENKGLPSYISPNNLYQFLFEYNQNPVLKSTCHEIDGDELEIILDYCKCENYVFEDHLQKIIQAYEEHENKFYTPYSVKAMIRGYLTGKDREGNELKKGWSTDNIAYHWSHEEIKKYTSQNKNTPPNLLREILRNSQTPPCKIDQFNSVITGKSIQTFRELVLHFKSLFHLKTDNSLHSLIIKTNERKGWNEHIEFIISTDDFPHNIELFTDVDKVLQAYTKLIGLIVDQAEIIDKNEKPKVKLTLTQQENAVYFSVHHLNSKYGKTVQDTIDRLGQTYTNLIKKQINGICNMYVKADFGNNQYAKINLWNGKNRSADSLKNSFQGVEHILEFEKNSKNDIPN